MSWHGSNDFAESAPTAPVSKSPRSIAEVTELTKKALMVSPAAFCVNDQKKTNNRCFHLDRRVDTVRRILKL